MIVMIPGREFGRLVGARDLKTGEIRCRFGQDVLLDALGRQQLGLVVPQFSFSQLALDGSGHGVGHQFEKVVLVAFGLVTLLQVEVDDAEQTVIGQDGNAVMTVRFHPLVGRFMMVVDMVCKDDFSGGGCCPAQAMAEFYTGATGHDFIGKLDMGLHDQDIGLVLNQENGTLLQQGKPGQVQNHFQGFLEKILEGNGLQGKVENVADDLLRIEVGLDVAFDGLAPCDVPDGADEASARVATCVGM